MSQTFSSWNDVPKKIEAKIVKMWNGCGTSTYSRSLDSKGEEVVVYKLADYKVGLNVDFLTNEQKIKLFELAIDHSIILSDFLLTLTFEPECFSIHNEIFHLPGIIVGTWPHCKLFGGMDETGYIHT